MKEIINVGVIGLGQRGMQLIEPMLKMADVRIIAVCDTYKDRVENAAGTVTKAGFPDPFQTEDYKAVLELEDMDAVVIATSWERHIEIAIESMKKGIFTAMEVGGTYHLQECFDLVQAHEETGMPFFFLENCCYGQRELMCLNMARKGVFGEIVHCDGAYKHDLRNEVSFGKENRHYRLSHYKEHNCENYPTHDLGPIAKILGINRGNRMLRLVSVASKACGLHEYIKEHKSDDEELMNTQFQQGDIVTTVITCENGETVTLTLDTTLPRIYSRNFTVHGTKGMYQEDGDYVFLEKDITGDVAEIDMDPQKIWKNADKYAEEYDNDLWKHKSKGMLESGHGGMDYLVLRSMVNAAKGETLPAIDVYDAAAWMCITALSEKSIQNGNVPVEIPDFTNGKYKNRTDKATGKYALD
ncbi:MAG: Gfo/Idh/MocA family protein [Acutalibacteraceae bacterium]